MVYQVKIDLQQIKLFQEAVKLSDYIFFDIKTHNIQYKE